APFRAPQTAGDDLDIATLNPRQDAVENFPCSCDVVLAVAIPFRQGVPLARKLVEPVDGRLDLGNAALLPNRGEAVLRKLVPRAETTPGITPQHFAAGPPVDDPPRPFPPQILYDGIALPDPGMFHREICESGSERIVFPEGRLKDGVPVRDAL